MSCERLAGWRREVRNDEEDGGRQCQRPAESQANNLRTSHQRTSQLRNGGGEIDWNFLRSPHHFFATNQHFFRYTRLSSGAHEHHNHNLPSSSKMSAPLQYYGFPISQPSRSVLMLLKAAGIEFEDNLVNVLAGEFLSLSKFLSSFSALQVSKRVNLF